MKRKHSVGYFSSYDRGLECLLNMWPKIKEQVPDATLDIYYGWNTFDAVHSNNPEQMRWKWSIVRKINELDGVTEHGRVSHQELADAMKEIQVWAYPTEFTEIHCITALKAQEAKCIPVYTNVAALETSVAVDMFKVDSPDIYTNVKAQSKFVDNVVAALAYTTPNDEYYKEVPKVDNRYWSDVAKVWSKAMA